MSLLELHIARVVWYIREKYEVTELETTHACRELQMRGRELGEILYTEKLPSLKVKDIARYIVLHT